jgi:hypothetical protein
MTIAICDPRAESLAERMLNFERGPIAFLGSQAAFSDTIVSLNPERKFRKLSLDQQGFAIAKWVAGIASARENLEHHLVWGQAMPRELDYLVAPSSLQLIVTSDDGAWFVSEYAGPTILDLRHNQSLDQTKTAKRLAQLLVCFERMGLVWADCNPRNLAVGRHGQWVALDLERLRAPKAVWTESDWARLYLSWQSVLGRERLGWCLYSRFNVDTLDFADQSNFEPDNWDREWFRQEGVDRPLTLGDKRRLMALSYSIERGWDVQGQWIDAHLLCCYLSDHAGRPWGVLGFRTLSRALNGPSNQFENQLLILTTAINFHRTQSNQHEAQLALRASVERCAAQLACDLPKP